MSPTNTEELRGVFPRDGSWGHRIAFEDYDEQRIHGWITPHLEEGDRFGFEMESGNVGIFEVVDVDRQVDPPDMFFGEVEPVGYADELGYDIERES